MCQVLLSASGYRSKTSVLDPVVHQDTGQNLVCQVLLSASGYRSKTNVSDPVVHQDTGQNLESGPA